MTWVGSSLRFIGAVALAFACGLGVRPASAQVDHPLYSCADQFIREVKDYATGVGEELTRCELKRLAGTGPAECLADTGVIHNLENLAEEFDRHVRESAPEGRPAGELCWGTVDGRDEGRAICPLESRNIDLFIARVLGGTCDDPAPGDGTLDGTCSNQPNLECDVDAACQPGTVRANVIALVEDAFLTPFAGCTRPTGAVSTAARECGDAVVNAIVDRGREIQQCYFSCEKQNLSSEDACIEEDGTAVGDEVVACLAQRTDPDGDLAPVVADCSAAEIAAIGCPLGATTTDGLVAALAARLVDEGSALDLDMFHSSCRTSLPGVPVPVAPAEVTLTPSLTRKQVACGDVLDAEFFGSDLTVSFDTDLNCTAVESDDPVTDPVHGIIIARNGVTVNGRAKTRSIIGPGKRSQRTGTGILVAPGIVRVTVSGFRRISNFGTGVADTSENRGIKVLRSTLFRNIEAGVRSSSPRTRVGEVTADRNGIGFDLSGDNSLITKSPVRSSEPQTTGPGAPVSPGYGIRLGGTDVDGNGHTVRVVDSKTILEGNVVGVVVGGSNHEVRGISVRSGLGDGIMVVGSANRIDSNSVKLNAGHGVNVAGDANQVEGNSCEDNSGNGFLVTGLNNVLGGNDAGAANHGNLQAGFVVSGLGTALDANQAEDNQGAGFVVSATTALFKGNRSKLNGTIGFDVGSTGNGLEANAAEMNDGAEYDLDAGNDDLTGNKKNGSTFSFTGAGGLFE